MLLAIEKQSIRTTIKLKKITILINKTVKESDEK